MSVTFINDSLAHFGGMERVASTVASGLAGRGHDVRVVALRGDTSAYPLHPDVRFTNLDLPAGHLDMKNKAVPFARALRRHLQRTRPHTIVTVDTYLSVYAYPAAAGLGLRRIGWEHFNQGADFGMRTRRLSRRLAAYAGHEVVTLTAADVQRWKAAYPGARARIWHLTNPLSFAQRPANPYSPERRTVLAVGWLNPRKGFDLLLDAWAQLEPQFPDWGLRIVGVGPSEADLRAQEARLGLGRVQWVGNTPHMEAEYLNAGVFCLSSRIEGLPMVLIESQACGVPGVAFDCPTGPAELLAPGGGVLVENGNVGALAASLREVMASPHQRLALSAAAYAASTRFDPERVLDQWEAVLRAPTSARSRS